MIVTAIAAMSTANPSAVRLVQTDIPITAVPAFGARPLKRVIQRELGDRLALALLEGSFGEGDTVTVDVDEQGEFTIG